MKIIKTHRRETRKAHVVKAAMPKDHAKMLDDLNDFIDREALLAKRAMQRAVAEHLQATEPTPEEMLEAIRRIEAENAEQIADRIELKQMAYMAVALGVLDSHRKKSYRKAVSSRVPRWADKWQDNSPGVEAFKRTSDGVLFAAIGESKRTIATRLRDRLTTGTFTAKEVWRRIETSAGLTAVQAEQNIKLYERLRDDLTASRPNATLDDLQGEAERRAARHAQIQRIERLYTIADNELTSSYNWAAQHANRLANEAGLLKTETKTWITAMDERVCYTCGLLNGETIPIDEQFVNPMSGFMVSVDGHAHTRCRCAVAYNE